MALSRRAFLSSVFGTIGSAALTPLDTMLNAVSASSGAARSQAIMALLGRRSMLLNGPLGSLSPNGDQQVGLFHLMNHMREEIDGTKAWHLNPVGWEPGLLTPNEVTAMRADMLQLQADYKAPVEGIMQEVEKIDTVLRAHPEDVKKAIEAQKRYFDIQDSIENIKTPPTRIDALKRELGSLPEPTLDYQTVHDASMVTQGHKPTNLELFRDDSTELNADIKTAIREATTPSSIKPEKRMQKRRTALLEHLHDMLQDLAEEKKIAVQSTLKSGYGDDKWHITTRMKTAEIGQEQDQRLHETIEHVKEIIEKIYPNSTASFIQHARPLQPGYGDHDCERLTITNPEYALRECLKDAETTYLKRHNIENTKAKISLAKSG